MTPKVESVLGCLQEIMERYFSKLHGRREVECIPEEGYRLQHGKETLAIKSLANIE